MTTHWNTDHMRRLGPPLRPPAETVEAYRSHLGSARSVLMFGVTRELAGLGEDLTAVDLSDAMIGGWWPGDTSSRRAVKGDWTALPFADGLFDAAIGDGSLNNVLDSAMRVALLSQAARVLKDSGRGALRCFVPDRARSPGEIVATAMDGGYGSFHAMKLALAMALTGPGPDHTVAVTTVLDCFNDLVPDRAELSRATGWADGTIATIDTYRGSSALYTFPPADQLIEEASSAFGDVSFAAAGGYPLAECCPMLILGRPLRAQSLARST